MLLHTNHVVSRDALVDGIWGERPPPTAAHTLDNYISRLRKTLGSGRLPRRAPGYMLHVEQVSSISSGSSGYWATECAARAGRCRRSGRDAARGLALWRGAGAGRSPYEPFAQGEAERLEERRLVRLENRIDADLARGGGRVVTELERLVRVNPQRERLLGQLMLALYRARRQAEALAVFQNARRRLAEELGLEPSPELRELERKILEHDPSLGVPRVE